MSATPDFVRPAARRLSSRARQVERRAQAKRRVDAVCFDFFGSSSCDGERRFYPRCRRGSARCWRAARQHGTHDRPRARDNRRSLRTFSTSRQWSKDRQGEFCVCSLADCCRCARRLQLIARDISEGKGYLSRVFRTQAVFSPSKTGNGEAPSSFSWIMKIPTFDLINELTKSHTSVSQSLSERANKSS